MDGLNITAAYNSFISTAFVYVVCLHYAVSASDEV